LYDNPKHPQALYGCGMLLMRQEKYDQALRYFDSVLKLDPHYVECRRARAVLCARCGKFDNAIPDINWCLERAPGSGFVLYGAACVAALVAGAAGDTPDAELWAQRALSMLGDALKQGYGLDIAAKDPDLAPIRERPEFRKQFQLVLSKARPKQQP
jgi:tetratricopeptide (TPR) repeat protein